MHYLYKSILVIDVFEIVKQLNIDGELKNRLKATEKAVFLPFDLNMPDTVFESRRKRENMYSTEKGFFYNRI